MSDKPLISTLDDLEEFCEMVGMTMQITFRTVRKPRWLVRIKRENAVKGDLIYRQACDDNLDMACQMVYHAWLLDQEAENHGRKGGKPRD